MADALRDTITREKQFLDRQSKAIAFS